jgi:AcrR family transcriptional regulator
MIWLSAMSSEKRSYELRARAERQQETRLRIIEATVALHQQVGPARTTVAEIARRARVQRLTVYNHFPEEEELFAACQRHFLAQHPLPDFAPALALEDPAERTRVALRALYRSYRERAPMTGKVLRDRSALPALDSLLERTMDAQQSRLAAALSAGFRARGPRRERLRALIGLALDFWTWHRLDRESLDDGSAAELMADVIGAAAQDDRVHGSPPS